jgi:Tfp pilus assembly protein PilV
VAEYKIQIPRTTLAWYTVWSMIHKGFSLVDTIVSIALLIVIALVIGGFVLSIPLRRAANYKTIAARIATDQLEKLHATQWSALPSVTTTVVSSALLDLPDGAGEYITKAWGGTTNIKEAQVIVSWTSKGRTVQYQQTTLLTDQEGV